MWNGRPACLVVSAVDRVLYVGCCGLGFGEWGMGAEE